MLSDRLAEAAEYACGGKFRIWGGDGERQDAPKDDNEGDPQGTPQDDNRGGAGDPDDVDDDDGDNDGGAGSPDKDNKQRSIEEELDELKRQNLSLKKSNDQLKAGKKKADTDKDVAKERDEALAREAKLEKVLNTRFLSWSIAMDSKYDWIDTEDVLAAIDREAIDIDLDKGEVKGLDLELKRIAKKKPHWLKKAEEEQRQEQGPTGQRGQGRGPAPKADEAETKRIGEKFRIPGYGSQNLRAL
jgi:hypothetical protein